MWYYRKLDLCNKMYCLFLHVCVFMDDNVATVYSCTCCFLQTTCVWAVIMFNFSDSTICCLFSASYACMDGDVKVQVAVCIACFLQTTKRPTTAGTAFKNSIISLVEKLASKVKGS